jgi:hypothetical protein
MNVVKASRNFEITSKSASVLKVSVTLGYSLMARIGRFAYGSDIAEPTLFFQHTYLTAVPGAANLNCVSAQMPVDTAW